MILKVIFIASTLLVHQLVTGFSISLDSSSTLCAKAVGSSVPKVACVTSQAAQQWTQNANGEVVNVGTGTCLTADYTLVGTQPVPVTLSACTGSATQLWDFTRTGIMLRSPATCGSGYGCVFIYVNQTTPLLINAFGGGDVYTLLNLRFQTVLGGVLKTVSFNPPALGAQAALTTTGSSTRFYRNVLGGICDNSNRNTICLLTNGKIKKFNAANLNTAGVGQWDTINSNILLAYVYCPNGQCPPSGTFAGQGYTYDSGISQFAICNSTTPGCSFTPFTLL